MHVAALLEIIYSQNIGASLGGSRVRLDGGRNAQMDLKSWLLKEGEGPAFKVLATWFFGDVVFAVIPLGVMALLTGLLGRDFREFPLLKEWSFATIIFCGVSIRQMMKLKIRVQHDPRHYTLDTGVQVIVVELIAAVLVLALVILMEMGAIPRSLTNFLGEAQLGLFAVGLVTSLSIAIGIGIERSGVREGLLKARALRHLAGGLGEAGDALGSVLYRLERMATARYPAPSDAIYSRIEEERLSMEVLNQVRRAEELIVSVRTITDSVVAPGAATPRNDEGRGAASLGTC